MDLESHVWNAAEPRAEAKQTDSDSTFFKVLTPGTSLVVQCLRLRTSPAGGTGLIPGQGNKIPHAVWP